MDPKTTIAILIGISNYKNSNEFPELPAAVDNVYELKKTLLTSIGIPKEKIHSRIDIKNREDFSIFINKVFDSNRDPISTVFFYYAGHGELSRDAQQFYLTLSDSNRSLLDDTAIVPNR